MDLLRQRPALRTSFFDVLKGEEKTLHERLAELGDAEPIATEKSQFKSKR